MKKLSLIITSLLLFACTSNNTNTVVKDNQNTNQIDYLQVSKDLESKLADQGVTGISTDITGNTYIISPYGKIIKIDRSTGNIDSKDNNDYYFGSLINIFFNVDSKGNGYLIPTTLGSGDSHQDPITNKITTYDKTKFLVYKIINLKIIDSYIINIQDYNLKSHCLSQDDCSDLYMNVGGINYSLNDFLKSKKEFIPNDDLRLDVGSPKEFFNSNGSGFYIKEENNIATLYSFINGINKKTDISVKIVDNLYSFDCNVDSLGNGYIIYNQDGIDKYNKINNYVIGTAKNFNVQINKGIYTQAIYNSINEQGNGFTIYGDNSFYNFSKINNFKIDTKKESLIDVADIYMSKKLISIDDNGNGYITFNKFEKLDNTGFKSIFKPRIFIVRNYNLISS